MKEKIIEDFINQIETKNLNNQAYLGLYFKDENTFIKANKEGILKLVLSLLKGLKDFNFHLSKKDHFSIINLEKEGWYDKDGIVIDFIEPTNKSRTEIYDYKDNQLVNKTSFKDTLTNFSFSLVLLFLFLSLIVGVFNVSKFIINLF